MVAAMRINQEQQVAMRELLSREEVVLHDNFGALSLAALVSPSDVVRSVVTSDPQTGLTKVLLLTAEHVVYAELPMVRRGSDLPMVRRGSENPVPTPYEPHIWVRPRAEVVSIEVGSVEITGDEASTDVHPTYVLRFRSEAPEFTLPWDGLWQSSEDASQLVSELLT